MPRHTACNRPHCCEPTGPAHITEGSGSSQKKALVRVHEPCGEAGGTQKLSVSHFASLETVFYMLTQHKA